MSAQLFDQTGRIDGYKSRDLVVMKIQVGQVILFNPEKPSKEMIINERRTVKENLRYFHCRGFE